MKNIRLEVTNYMSISTNDKITDVLDCEYNDKTTLADLIMDRPKNDYLMCDNSSFKNGRFLISFLIVDGKCQWLIPYDQCLVKDYIDTYFRADDDPILKFKELRQIGGVSPFQIFDHIAMICNILTVIEFTNKLLRWADKHFKLNNIYVGIEDLDKSIRFKNKYSLKDFCFEFDLDEDCASILLNFFGYEYFENYDLFFYVDALHEKNKKLLLEKMSERL